MFKNKFKILLIFILLIFISATSFADDSLSISSWIVHSKLLEDGDLNISEDITFDFKDKFNGVYRNIVLQGTDGISGLELYEIVEGKEIPYSYDILAEKGDKKVFKSETINNTEEIMIFSPSKDESKTFRIKYTLKNVGIVHDDTGEIYYKFIGEENNTPVKHFSARINLPSIDRENTKIFAHGPSNGRINFMEDDRIKLEVSGVSSNTFVEARILFPKNFISASGNQGTSNFSEIIDEEIAFANKVQENHERTLKLQDTFKNISVIAAGLDVLVLPW